MTKGYQVTFFTEPSRKHGHQPLADWLLQLARTLGIRGGTSIPGAGSFGRPGRPHMAHFFSLGDQAIEITMAMTEEQVEALFARLREERLDLFYVKSPVEYGRVGAPPASP